MRRRLVISRNAETDLIFIWVYYAEKSEQAAHRIRQDIVSKYNLLLQFPVAGRSRDELLDGRRSLPAGHHVIYYRETNDGIEIVRVLHDAQDVHGIFLSEDESEEEP